MLVSRQRKRVRLRLEALEDRLAPSVATNTALVAVVNGSLVSNITYGTPVTLTATVTAQTGSSAPSLGSVDFVDMSTNFDLGVVSTDTTSGSDAVFQLITTARTFQAIQAGGGVHAIGAAYTPGDGFDGSTGTLAGGLQVKPASLTFTAQTNTKTYDSTNLAAAIPTVSGLLPGDSVAGLSEAYDTANAGSGKTLSVNIDPVPSATLTGLSGASFLAFDGSGNLYVNNDGPTGVGTTISKFPPGATTASATLSGVHAPEAMIFDSSGNLYVSNGDKNTVSVFAPGATNPTATLNGLSSPNIMVLDGKGNLYVANGGNNTVSVFAPGATTPTATLTGLDLPQAMAIDSSGNLYVTNLYPGLGTTVSKFAPGALTPTATLTGVSTPVALIFDGNGELYVSNYSTGTISLFDPGATTPSSTLAGLVNPSQMAFDSHGNLFVISSGSTVCEFKPGSNVPSATITGLSGAEGLVIDSSDNLYVSNIGTSLSGTTVSKFRPGYTIKDGNNGMNYVVTTISDSSGVIDKVVLTIPGPIVGNKVYDGTSVATLYPGTGVLFPGDILKDDFNGFNKGRIREITTAGSVVRTINLSTSDQLRGMVLDANGHIDVYRGASPAYLSIIDPSTGTEIASTTFSGWTTADTATSGGIAAYGNYVFVTDMNTGSGVDNLNGIIRFNINDLSAQRFAGGGDAIQLTIGQDGLLYEVLSSGADPSIPYIQVFNPLTLAFVRSIALSVSRMCAIAVDQMGNIYGVTGIDNYIYEFNTNGNSIKTVVNTGSPGYLNDININSLGQIEADSGAALLETTTALSTFTVSDVGNLGNLGHSWSAWVQAPQGFASTLSVQGIVGNDVVSLNTAGATAAFATRNAGTGIAVTVFGLTLIGPQVSNYDLILPTVSADITPAP